MIPNTADGLFHMHRIEAMSLLLEQGDLYPRWIPWFHLGYGYPVFNFYAPAGTYLGGLLGVLGLSAPAAFNIISTLSWMIGSTGIYAIGRRYLSPTAAILAVFLWVYAPTRLHEIWNQGSLSHIVATGLTPWFFWAVLQSIIKPGYRHTALLAALTGTMLLAHQPTTFLVMLFAGPGTLFISIWLAGNDHKQLIRRLSYTAFGVVLGLGIAMIFLLPMALELEHISITEETDNINGLLLNNFIDFDELFIQPPIIDLTDYSSGIPHTWGFINGLLAVLGIFALLRLKKYTTAGFLMMATVFSIFLLLEISLLFWQNIPLMDQLRFAWRVLRVGIVFLSLLGGAFILLLPSRWRILATVVSCVVVILLAMPTVYPPTDLLDYGNLQPSDSIRYELESGAIGGTSYNEFKPNWGVAAPNRPAIDINDIDEHPMRIWANQPDEDIATVMQIDDQTVNIIAQETFTLNFHQFYYPNWSASLDGQSVEAFAEDNYGLLSVVVPPGEHVVRVWQHNTSAATIGTIITLCSLLIVGVLYIKNPVQETSPPEKLQPKFALGMIGGILVFTFINTAYIAPETILFRQQSPTDSPSAMQNAVHETFGDAYELLGYTLDDHTVTPGGDLEITLFWRALTTNNGDYRPVVQLIDWSNTEAWAVSTPLIIGPNIATHTPDRFVSDTHTLSVFDDAPSYTGRIVVWLMDSYTGEKVQKSDGESTVILDEIIRVEGNNPNVKRLWNYNVGNHVELICASIEENGQALDVSLYWHVLNPFDTDDLRTLVHAVDVDGNIVAQADAPPLNGKYPTSHWTNGQIIEDHHTLPNDETIHSVLIGLYTLDGVRLNVTENGNPMTNNTIELTRETQECKNNE